MQDQSIMSKSSAEASPARTSVSRDWALGWPACDQACGSSSPASSKSSSRPTRSSRMSQPFALVDWIPCSGASLRSGMMRSGTVYPLPPLAPLTAGTGSGSSRFPTPRATDGPKGAVSATAFTASRVASGQANLSEFIQHFAAPTARDWRSGKASQATMERNSRPLSEQIGGSLNPTWVEWLMGFEIGWTDLGASETR